MSLENVYIWKDGEGYVPINIEEACDCFPEKVTYKSQIFICKLCGQYVTLTGYESGKRARYFRHAPVEYGSLKNGNVDADKLCADRARMITQIYQKAQSLASHVMPMRLELNSSSFALLIGFYCPQEFINNTNGLISLQNNSVGYERTFSTNRLIPGEVTYFNLGSLLLDKYDVCLQNISRDLAQFWPSCIEGFLEHGGVFYAESGRRIYRGAKVSVRHKFLFLFSSDYENWFLEKTKDNTADTKKLFPTHESLNQFSNAWNKPKESKWCIYQLEMSAITKDTIDLFLTYGIDLVNKVADFHQVWPPYICTVDNTINSAKELYFYLNSKVEEVKIYPQGDSLCVHQGNHGLFYLIKPNQKTQLLTLGAYGALGYTYLQYNESELSAVKPKLSITNNLGQILDKTSYDDISGWKYISVESEVDGKLKIYENGKLIDIRLIKGGNDNKQLLSPSDLVLGRRYDFFQSCTLVHSLELIAPKIVKEQAEPPLVKPETPKFSFRYVDFALRQTLQFCLLSSLGYQHLGSNGLFEHKNSRKPPILALKDYISSISMTNAVVNENTSVSTVNNGSNSSTISSKALIKKLFAPKTSDKQDLSLIPAKAQDHDVKQDQASTIDLMAKFHVLDQQEFNCNEQQIIKLSSQFALKKISKYQSSQLSTKLYGLRVLQVALKHLKYDDYPLTIEWLKKHAEQGTINHQVMRNLMSFF